jgi:hypothetical protein
MRLRSAWLLSPSAGLVVATGVPAEQTRPAPHATRSAHVFTCLQHVEGPKAPRQQVREARRTSITLPNLTLWGVRRARGASFGPAGTRTGWKAGVSVRGYRAVTIRVATRDRTWLALDYVPGRDATRVADGDSTVRFEPCPRGTRRFSDGRPVGAETAWAGAFVVARAGCATLLVRRDGVARSTRIRVGFGERCS